MNKINLKFISKTLFVINLGLLISCDPNNFEDKSPKQCNKINLKQKNRIKIDTAPDAINGLNGNIGFSDNRYSNHQTNIDNKFSNYLNYDKLSKNKKNIILENFGRNIKKNIPSEVFSIIYKYLQNSIKCKILDSRRLASYIHYFDHDLKFIKKNKIVFSKKNIKVFYLRKIEIFVEFQFDLSKKELIINYINEYNERRNFNNSIHFNLDYIYDRFDFMLFKNTNPVKYYSLVRYRRLNELEKKGRCYYLILDLIKVKKVIDLSILFRAKYYLNENSNYMKVRDINNYKSFLKNLTKKPPDFDSLNITKFI